MIRAVELTQRGTLIVAMLARLLGLAGRRAEALALRAELESRQWTEYVGPAAFLLIDAVIGDEETLAATLQRNIDAGTGPLSLSTSGGSRELDRLLDHPRLGPLVRRISIYEQSARDSTTPAPIVQRSVSPPPPAKDARVVTPV